MMFFIISALQECRMNVTLDNKYIRLKVHPANYWHQPDRIKEEKEFDLLIQNSNFSAECDSQTLIHNLNDDCLSHIFSFLTITDRVRIERGTN